MYIYVDNNNNIIRRASSDKSVTQENEKEYEISENRDIEYLLGCSYVNNLLVKKDTNVKYNRMTLVSEIEVTYQGIIYQGDETSQDRMSRAINGLPDDTTTIYWKAKDNSSQELTRLDLKEILFLAGQEQTRIWFN